MQRRYWRIPSLPTPSEFGGQQSKAVSNVESLQTYVGPAPFSVHSTKRSSFYMVATKIDPQHPEAVLAIEKWKKIWTTRRALKAFQAAGLFAKYVVKDIGVPPEKAVLESWDPARSCLV